jgi:hypothetical protein
MATSNRDRRSQTDSLEPVLFVEGAQSDARRYPQQHQANNPLLRRVPKGHKL